MKKSIVAFLLAFTVSIMSYSQTTFSGTVVDENSVPLPGASVVVKGSTSGVAADFDGNFEIELSQESAVLVVSYIGYISQEFNTTGQTTATIMLQPDSQQLDEVVVTALNITRDEKTLGYAVEKVGGDEVSQSTSTNFVSTLSGRAAGVQVVTNGTGPGQSSSVVIRGYSSMQGDNQPLFVVDGIPINNSTDTRTNTLGGASNMNLDYGNGAAEVNPDDIESVSVLKGANATALYGSRAANGAVIITTKSGRSRKGMGISVNSKMTFESMLKGPEYQRVYGQGKNFDFQFVDGYGNGTFDGVDESWGPLLDGTLRAQHDSPTANGLRGGDVHGLDFILGSSGVDLSRRGAINPTPFVDPGDPVENFVQTGRTLTNNISFYGGNEKGNYRVSYTNLDNEGILPNTDIRRNTISLSGTYDLTDRLTVNSKVNYIRTDSDNRHVNGYGTESVMYLFIWWGQQVDVKGLRDYWQDGLEGFQQFNYNYNYHDNPYFTMYENTNGLAKDRIIGNLSATYKLSDNFKFMVRGGRDFFSEYRFIKRAYSTQRFPNGQYREDKINFQETNLDFLLSYDQQIGEDFSVNANFGGNRMVQKNHFNALMANKLLLPGIYSFTNADGPLVQTVSRPEKQINSLYGFAQLGWKDQIFLDLTARNDWSSTLPKENNSYFYPSASLSMLVTDMFNIDSDVLSFAKLRAGWAQVGNDTNPYGLNNFFALGTPVGSNPTASPSNNLANANLKPEIQTSYEIGTDLRLFNNKIGIDFTYYNTISKNQILDIDLATTSGKTSRTINAGKIKNYGVELMLDATPVSTDNFSWNTMFNFGLNRNEILELADGVDRYSYGGNGITLIAEKGGSLGDMWGTGLVTVQDESSPYYGEVFFNEGLVQQDNTLRKLGNFNPDFTLGWNNTITYKNFSLNFLFDWRQGGELLSRTRLIAATSGNVVETLWGRSPEFGGPHPGILDSGLDYGGAHSDGVIGDGVKGVFDVEGNLTGYTENDVIVPANAYHNNRYRRDNETEGIYDATFIKLREAKLTYALPRKVVDKMGVQDFSFSLIGTNLWLWAKDFNHGDPELLSFGGGSYVPGVENATVPTTRSIGMAVSLRL